MAPFFKSAHICLVVNFIHSNCVSSETKPRCSLCMLNKHLWKICKKKGFLIPIVLPIATRQMIQAYFLSNGSDYVEIHWTYPKFLPERYQLKYMCALKAISRSEEEENDYLVSNIRNLTSDTTLVRVTDLPPRSFCVLVLLAVYNPASIDSGIVITGTTGKLF